MQSKRIGASLAAAALVTTLFGGVAHAETMAPVTPEKSTQTPTKPPELEPGGEVKAALAALERLQNQGRDLESQIKKQSALNDQLRERLRKAVTRDLEQKLKELRERAAQTVKAKIAPLRAQIKELESKLQRARAAHDEATVHALQEQLTALRAQVSAQLEAMKDLNAQIKALQMQLKARMDALKGGLEHERDLLSQERALWVKLQDLGRAEREARGAFERARAAKDQKAMLAALNQGLTVKQGMVEGLQQILALKKQDAQLLQAAMNSAQTPGTNTGAPAGSQAGANNK